MKWIKQRRIVPWLLAFTLIWSLASFLSLRQILHTDASSRNGNGKFTALLEGSIIGGEFEDRFIEPDNDIRYKFSQQPLLPPPRFLLGIFSHDLYRMEKDRRQAVRDTYLSFYKNYSTNDGNENDGNSINKTSSNRICALNEILEAANIAKTNKILDLWPEGCQMAYTFVVGGGVNGSQTELLSTTASSDMVTEIPHNERDVLSLNIQENGEYGKSTTWFRYASLLLQEHDNLGIDYIIKTDSDTLIIPHRFLGWIDEQEMSQNITSRTRIYGGVPMDKMTCGWPSHDHCSQLKAPIYMGGALYFVTLDLATYVTSSQCHRERLFLPHEDMAMANYVFSLVNNSESGNASHTITTFSNPDAYLNTWKHPIKSPKRMWNSWRKFLSARKKRQRTKILRNSTQ